MVNAIRSAPPIPSIDCCTLLRKGECFELIRRVVRAAIDLLKKFGRWLCDCLDPLLLAIGCLFDVPLGSKARTLEKINDYRTLPIYSPQFEYRALDLAKPLLTEDEMENVRNFIDPQLFAKIIVRASIFSGRPPVYRHLPLPVFDYVQWREWMVLSMGLAHQYLTFSANDKIALLTHIDSEIITLRTNGQFAGYALRSKNPLRPNNPPEAKISWEAKKWYEQYNTASYDAIHRYHPLMQSQPIILQSYA